MSQSPDAADSADADAARALLAQLCAIVGDGNVLVGADVSGRHDNYPPIDAMTALCIVRPKTTVEVSALVRLCHGAGVTVVPQGGRTGLAGGARSRAHEVALSLERMTAIEPVDTMGATVVAEAGVPLQTLQDAARAAGLYYPVDLGARGSATVGGTIATNAGGNSVFRYGMTRDQILGLEVVLADGTVISGMNRMIKNNSGYDLKQLFIGSEGTLGIVTRAVLRLRPDPGERATALIGVACFADVLALFARMSAAADGTLSSFELMWPQFVETVLSSGRHGRPLADSHAFYLLVEVVSHRSEALLQTIIEEAWDSGLIADATLAQTIAQGRALWAIRDDIDAVAERLRPMFLYDVSLPQAAMASYVERLDQELRQRWPDAALVVFGHIADGNLHLCISTGEAADHDAVDALVYTPLASVGGSISAEHGIGLEKRGYLEVSRQGAEIDLMRAIKQVLDPRGVLNPGKILLDGPDAHASASNP